MKLILSLLVVVVVSAAPPAFEEFTALSEVDHSIFAKEPADADSDKEEVTSPVNGSPDDDIEIFQAPKENDTELAEILREFNPYNLLHGGSDMTYLRERAKYLASLPRQHRAQLFEFELPTAHKKNERVMVGMQAVELFNNLKNMNNKPSTNLEECEESRRVALADLQSLALNASLMEVRLELLEMAQERAERQARSAVIDVLDCHKHMAVLEYIKNDTHRSMEAMNFTMEKANEDALECRMSKIRLESQIDVMETQIEDERANYRSAKKSLEEMQRKMLEAKAEVKVAKEEIQRKLEEKADTETKLEQLRHNLMELRTNVSNTNTDDANLQLDTLESLNDLLVTQMDIMTQENVELRTTHEKEMEQLVMELDQCDTAKLEAENQGSQYWQYKDFELLPDFPKEISEGFPGVPDNIDAAFIWKITGKLYLFKDESYWQAEGDDTYTVHGIHAKFGGAGWHGGVPHNLDAIFDFHSSTIFLKKDLYYRYSDSSSTVAESLPPYPRLSCTWLFGCPASSECVKRRRV